MGLGGKAAKNNSNSLCAERISKTQLGFHAAIFEVMDTFIVPFRIHGQRHRGHYRWGGWVGAV